MLLLPPSPLLPPLLLQLLPTSLPQLLPTMLLLLQLLPTSLPQLLPTMLLLLQLLPTSLPQLLTRQLTLPLLPLLHPTLSVIFAAAAVRTACISSFECSTTPSVFTAFR